MVLLPIETVVKRWTAVFDVGVDSSVTIRCRKRCGASERMIDWQVAGPEAEALERLRCATWRAFAGQGNRIRTRRSGGDVHEKIQENTAHEEAEGAKLVITLLTWLQGTQKDIDCKDTPVGSRVVLLVSPLGTSTQNVGNRPRCCPIMLPSRCSYILCGCHFVFQQYWSDGIAGSPLPSSSA